MDLIRNGLTRSASPWNLSLSTEQSVGTRTRPPRARAWSQTQERKRRAACQRESETERRKRAKWGRLERPMHAARKTQWWSWENRDFNVKFRVSARHFLPIYVNTPQIVYKVTGYKVAL